LPDVVVLVFVVDDVDGLLDPHAASSSADAARAVADAASLLRRCL
jgi:hypothetical protein